MNQVNPLTERIVEWCLPLGLAAIIIGAVVALYEYRSTRVPTTQALPEPEAQGLDESLQAVAKIGEVLNSAAVSVRFFVVGLALVAFAAVAAGADAISDSTATGSPTAASTSSP